MAFAQPPPSPDNHAATEAAQREDTPAIAIPSEVLEKLPPQVKQQILSVAVQQFSGPVPPPDVLEQYERILPGSAARLLQLTEKEQAHRHGMEEKVLGTKAADVKRGQYLGFAIAVLAVAGAIFTASTSALVAVALVSVPVASIINAIVRGRSDTKR